MKIHAIYALVLVACLACSQVTDEKSLPEKETGMRTGQSAVKDDDSQKNIVQTAVASSDHTTLVAALKAAGYVDALTNAGPFTVFAPNNQAFEQLPEGTVKDLLKPENKLALQDILEYHVYVGVIRESIMKDGMKLDQVNGKKISLTKDGDKIQVNGANIIGVVPTSNGIVYVIDKVLLP